MRITKESAIKCGCDKCAPNADTVRYLMQETMKTLEQELDKAKQVVIDHYEYMVRTIIRAQAEKSIIYEEIEKKYGARARKLIEGSVDERYTEILDADKEFWKECDDQKII